MDPTRQASFVAIKAWSADRSSNPSQPSGHLEVKGGQLSFVQGPEIPYARKTSLGQRIAACVDRLFSALHPFFREISNNYWMNQESQMYKRKTVMSEFLVKHGNELIASSKGETIEQKANRTALITLLRHTAILGSTLPEQTIADQLLKKLSENQPLDSLPNKVGLECPREAISEVDHATIFTLRNPESFYRKIAEANGYEDPSVPQNIVLNSAEQYFVDGYKAFAKKELAKNRLEFCMSALNGREPIFGEKSLFEVKQLVDLELSQKSTSRCMLFSLRQLLSDPRAIVMGQKSVVCQNLRKVFDDLSVENKKLFIEGMANFNGLSENQISIIVTNLRMIFPQELAASALKPEVSPENMASFLSKKFRLSVD